MQGRPGLARGVRPGCDNILVVVPWHAAFPAHAALLLQPFQEG